MIERNVSHSTADADLAVCAVRWAGEVLHLLPDHAVWWPAGRVLFIADLHLGKAATYRALGQPVPAGTTRENLRRLDVSIARHRPAQLVFLGDFLHGPLAQQAPLLDPLHAWRAMHHGIAMTLVRGNHDDRAGDPPTTLDIDVVDEPHCIGPFACCHIPQQHASHFVLAGHVHPVCRLFGRGRESMRLPCFVGDAGAAILPAFGEFTGGYMVEPQAGRRLYGVGGGRVWALPAAIGGQSRRA